MHLWCIGIRGFRRLHKEGHVGLSLILFSPFMLLFRSLNADMTYVLITCVLMAAFSSLPDIDIELQGEYGIKHRGITHTFLFGIGVGILLGILMSYAYASLGWLMGFIAGFGSTASHILGDTFTFEQFSPFSPFSSMEVSFGLFGSSNKIVNNFMLGLGVIVFLISYEPSIFWQIFRTIKEISGI